MFSRSYLVFFFLVFATAGFANDANWNCRQNDKTKAWDCVGTSQVVQKPSPASAPKKAYPTKATAPSSAKLVGQPEPVREGNGFAHPDTDSNNPATLNATETKPTKATGSAGRGKVIPENNQPSITGKQPEPADNGLAGKSTQAKSEAPPVIPADEKPATSTTSKPAAASAPEQRGWQCNTKGKDGNWNCQLTGADPKGEARVVEAGEHGFSLLTPAFDNKQESVFYTLRDRLKTNPWGNCTMQLGTQKYFVADKSQREKADTDMNANYTEIYDNEVGNYQGNVDLKRADQRASANSANYDAVSETLDLHGNVFYSEDELSLHTDTATLKLNSDEAKLRDALFISPVTPIRGKASAVYRDSKAVSRYKDVAYTSCQPGNQDWIVHASDLKMNKNDGTGSAKNTWVEFKGVPVFYSPYLSFPIDSRRKSGFLAPVYGNTTKGGFSLSTPFYWNIAPNLDATLRPRYYTSRGILLAGDFRYLTEKTRGLVSGEYMPNDNVTDKPRYLATIKNSTSFTPNISSNLDLNLVSDKLYFSELGNALSFPTFSQIRSTADVSYVDNNMSLVGRVESYQIVDPTITGRAKPYRRLPQINFNWGHEFESLSAFTALESEYVYFQHDDGRLPDGHRFNIKPSVSFPLKAASAYVTPKLSIQHTDYLLDYPRLGVSDSISRTLPIASIDSGVFLEKGVNIAGSSFLHTLEPRLFYLYIPRVNQKNIPIFDTSLYDLSYGGLFRENRFNGTDRIQDANQITTALTSKLIDSETGLERLKFNIGEIFYLQNRDVTAPVVRVGSSFLESTVQTSSFSPVVAELSGQVNKHFSVDTGLQWDPHTNDILRGNALLHFVNNPGELFNVGFTYRKNNLVKDALDNLLLKSDPEIADIFTEQGITNINRRTLESYRNSKSIIRGQDIVLSDVSFRWPIYNDWFAVGRWQYSLLYNKTQDAFLGFEKENCCWRFKIIARHFSTSTSLNGASNFSTATATSASQTGIFFQVEFKGLTGLGTKLDDFFAKSIYGYQRTEF